MGWRIDGLMDCRIDRLMDWSLAKDCRIDRLSDWCKSFPILFNPFPTLSVFVFWLVGPKKIKQTGNLKGLHVFGLVPVARCLRNPRLGWAYQVFWFFKLFKPLCLFFYVFFENFVGKMFGPKLVRNKEKHAEKQSRMTDKVILLRSDQFSADLAGYGPDSGHFSCFGGVPKSFQLPQFIKKSEISNLGSEKNWTKIWNKFEKTWKT